MDESENYGVLFEDDDMVRLRYEDGVKEMCIRDSLVAAT